MGSPTESGTGAKDSTKMDHTLNTWTTKICLTSSKISTKLRKTSRPSLSPMLLEPKKQPTGPLLKTSTSKTSWNTSKMTLKILESTKSKICKPYSWKLGKELPKQCAQKTIQLPED